MSQTSHYAVQKAIFSLLTQDESLSAMVKGVFDYVPSGTEYPYITIGESQVRDASTLSECLVQVVMAIQVYGRGKGRKDVDAIMAQVQALMESGGLTVDGHQVVDVHYRDSEILLLRDGETYHGRLRFNLLLQKL